MSIKKIFTQKAKAAGMEIEEFHHDSDFWWHDYHVFIKGVQKTFIGGFHIMDSQHTKEAMIKRFDEFLAGKEAQNG